MSRFRVVRTREEAEAILQTGNGVGIDYTKDKHMPQNQQLKKFLVEEWQLISLINPKQGRWLAYKTEVEALDGYGAACYYAGIFGIKPEQWHDLDGTGKPDCVLRVTELDKYEYRMREDGGMDHVKIS